MKTRLLKKLRKKAHDKYRIAPEEILLTGNNDYNWCVKEFSDSGWRDIYNYLTLDEAKERISDERYNEFKDLARRLINKRKCKKMLKQVKRLQLWYLTS